MIDAKTITAMVNHWLATPVNGYFYQNYGCTVKEQLLKNLTAFNADAFIAKMIQDIPILGELAQDELNIISETVGFEQVNVFIQIGSVLVEVGRADTGSAMDEDYQDVTAQ